MFLNTNKVSWDKRRNTVPDDESLPHVSELMEADSAGQTQEVIILVYYYVFGANFHFPTNFIHSQLCGSITIKVCPVLYLLY